MKALIFLFFVSTCFAQQKFGWIGDDGKKLARSASPNQWAIKTVAASSDLTSKLPKVLDQGNIGSCVAHGTSEAWSYALNKNTNKFLQLSRLQIYYDARVKIGTQNSDSGCQIVDAVNNLMRLGGAEETLWPYKTVNYRIKPAASIYTNAKKHTVVQAFKVDNTDSKSIRLALTNGYPVIVGSLVYNGIMGLNKKNYTLPYPKTGERPIGGHCYLITGHDEATQLFRGRNSWSTDWGNKGDFLLPYKYIHNGRITEDCWVIVEVTK